MNTVRVKTEFPVAFDSPDHIVPWGTRLNSSRNHRFNQKIYKMYPKTRLLRILDLGCSGGGFVRDCLDDGHFAIGLEGSDFSKKRKRAEWRFLPDNLFTCDVSKPFSIVDPDSDTPVQFDIITAWELLEHIKTEDVSVLMANIRKHLDVNGLFIASVSIHSDCIGDVDLHQNRMSREEWVALSQNQQLSYHPQYLHYFNSQYVAGTRETRENFHLVLARNDAKDLPVMPAEGMKTRIYDYLNSSSIMSYIRMLIVGYKGM